MDKIHSVQMLRAMAATLVVLFHVHKAFARWVAAPTSASESYLFGFGAIGVHIFFVISGFIMVLTNGALGTAYSVRSFYWRRFLRIYPIYWICVLAYLSYDLLLDTPRILTPGSVVGALLLLPGDSSLIIGPAWTLTYEILFYLCFGLAMILPLHQGLLALTAVFLAAIAIGAGISDKGAVLHVVTNTLLLEFLAGTAIGWLATTDRLPRGKGAALTTAGILLCVAGLAYGYSRLPSAIMWGVPSAILVLGLVAWEKDIGANAAVRWLGRLGDSSYVLYLIHILMISMAIDLCRHLPAGWNPSPAIAALIVAPIAIILAKVVHRRIEAPILRRFRPAGGGDQGAEPDRKRAETEFRP